MWGEYVTTWVSFKDGYSPLDSYVFECALTKIWRMQQCECECVRTRFYDRVCNTPCQFLMCFDPHWLCVRMLSDIWIGKMRMNSHHHNHLAYLDQQHHHCHDTTNMFIPNAINNVLTASTLTYTRTHTKPSTHTYTRTHTITRTHARKTYWHTHTGTRTHVRTCTDTHMHTHARTHTDHPRRRPIAPCRVPIAIAAP